MSTEPNQQRAGENAEKRAQFLAMKPTNLAGVRRDDQGRFFTWHGKGFGYFSPGGLKQDSANGWEPFYSEGIDTFCVSEIQVETFLRAGGSLLESWREERAKLAEVERERDEAREQASLAESEEDKALKERDEARERLKDVLASCAVDDKERATLRAYIKAKDAALKALLDASAYALVPGRLTVRDGIESEAIEQAKAALALGKEGK